MEKEYHVIRIIRRHVNGKINAPIKWWIISELNLIVCLHDRIITKLSTFNKTKSECEKVPTPPFMYSTLEKLGIKTMVISR